MGYEYGIEIARQAAIKVFSGGKELKQKLTAAFSEITVIEEEDVTKEHFKEIKELFNKYLNEKTENIKEMESLGNSLIHLSCDICEENGKLLGKGKKEP